MTLVTLKDDIRYYKHLDGQYLIHLSLLDLVLF